MASKIEAINELVKNLLTLTNENSNNKTIEEPIINKVKKNKEKPVIQTAIVIDDSIKPVSKSRKVVEPIIIIDDSIKHKKEKKEKPVIIIDDSIKSKKEKKVKNNDNMSVSSNESIKEGKKRIKFRQQ